MVEVGVQPGVGAVASRAIGRECGRHMAGIRGGFEICGVAGVALRRHRLKLAAGGAFMAGVAVYGRMCSSQRETVVVLLDLLHAHLPASDCVALFAVGPELTAVNISVTVLTVLSSIGEHRLDMALGASDRLVHAAQRVFRLIVIEFRNRANRLPCARCVAILTGDVQVSVRTMRPLGLLRSRRHSAQCQGKQHNKSGYAP